MQMRREPNVQVETMRVGSGTDYLSLLGIGGDFKHIITVLYLDDQDRFLVVGKLKLADAYGNEDEISVIFDKKQNHLVGETIVTDKKYLISLEIDDKRWEF